MAYLLALASAGLYGAADFLGGLAARRASAIATVVISQAAGAALLALIVPLLPAAAPMHTDFIWGAAAGLAGGTGVALLYRALAVGAMAVVAPTTAVCAVAIPVMAGLVVGERPSTSAAVGIVLALAAIVLVSQTQQESGSVERHGRTPRSFPPGLALALLSGVAIGLFFLALARTASTAGMWPLLAARLTSVTLFLGMALGTGTRLRVERPVVTLAVVGGVIDMAANALYLIATRYGLLTIVVTLASLYPASTVILARVVLHERFSSWQVAGIICALVAVALIVAG